MFLRISYSVLENSWNRFETPLLESLGRTFSPLNTQYVHQWLHVNAKTFSTRHFSALISTIVLLFLFIQWLCNADKSSHVPRLRLKYVYLFLLVFMLVGNISLFLFYFLIFLFIVLIKTLLQGLLWVSIQMLS